ncbi:hypothetical protein [Streptomyces griseosporeus]|uniref:hypothetical protein n=1 Tax=Streptomyces griseosporeus TaxID=1910 RepID=UPI0036F6ACD0
MFAFLTRRKEATMPETPTTVTTTPQTDTDVVMRFLTQGGATVELHHQVRTVRHIAGRPGYLLPDNQSRTSHGFNWRCLGCGSIGGGGPYGMGYHHFDEYEPNESRDEANEHAAQCRAMPKPTA